MKLTPHFTLEEMVASEAAARAKLDNTPTDRIVENLQFLCERLEEVRELLGGAPIIVTSGYRSQALNSLIGGSPTSQHRFGLACDFICPAVGDPHTVCTVLFNRCKSFDQLIHEFGHWTHISFVRRNPRQEPLTTFDGKKYVPGILTRDQWERKA